MRSSISFTFESKKIKRNETGQIGRVQREVRSAHTVSVGGLEGKNR
jgi:hypothetical protein